MSYKVKDFLNEVFDNPWKHEIDHHETEYAKSYMNSVKARNPHEDIIMVRAHKLEGDNGHLISYIRNGAYEVHHLNVNHESGFISQDASHRKPNPRFYSTMIDMIKKNALDKSKKARITTDSDELFKRYKSVSRKLKEKHGYHVEYQDDNFDGKTQKSIIISPRPKLAIKEFLEERNGYFCSAFLYEDM